MARNDSERMVVMTLTACCSLGSNVMSQMPFGTTIGPHVQEAMAEVDQQPGEASVLRALSPGYKAVGNP